MLFGLYLALGHFLADFALQPLWLVRWKEAHTGGVLFHAGVHFLVYCALLVPFLHEAAAWTALMAVAFLHVFIDQLKINEQKKTKKFVRPFYYDQTLHLVTIAAAAIAVREIGPRQFSGNFNSFYENPWIPGILIAAIVALVVPKIVGLQIRKEGRR